MSVEIRRDEQQQTTSSIVSLFSQQFIATSFISKKRAIYEKEARLLIYKTKSVTRIA